MTAALNTDPSESRGASRPITASRPHTEQQPLLLPDETVLQQPYDGEDDPHCAELPDSNSHFRVVAVATCFLSTGVHVTAIGALMPTLEDYYSLNHSTAAFLFPMGVVGYVIASILMPKVVSIYGWRAIALASPILHLTSDLLLSTGPAFSFVLAGYFIGGLGTGLSDCGFCSWASKRPYANIVQGFMHGAFSIGCVLGPLVIVVVLNQGFEWFISFRMMAILSCIELASLGIAFRKESSHAYRMAQEKDDQSKMEHSPRTKLVIVCSTFFFLYLSVEASFTIWIVTYMQRVRHVGLAAASLSSSLFWLGMALGRSVLGIVTEKFGLSISVTAYILLSACLQLIFKLTWNVPASLVLLGTIGFFLGPMFPSGVLLLASRMPLDEAIGAVAAAVAIGQVGGAVAPLAIGFMADNLGMEHLPDVVLALSIPLLIIWLAYVRFVQLRSHAL